MAGYKAVSALSQPLVVMTNTLHKLGFECTWKEAWNAVISYFNEECFNGSDEWRVKTSDVKSQSLVATMTAGMSLGIWSNELRPQGVAFEWPADRLRNPARADVRLTVRVDFKQFEGNLTVLSFTWHPGIEGTPSANQLLDGAEFCRWSYHMYSRIGSRIYDMDWIFEGGFLDWDPEEGEEENRLEKQLVSLRDDEYELLQEIRSRLNEEIPKEERFEFGFDLGQAYAANPSKYPAIHELCKRAEKGYLDGIRILEGKPDEQHQLLEWYRSYEHFLRCYSNATDLEKRIRKTVNYLEGWQVQSTKELCRSYEDLAEVLKMTSANMTQAENCHRFIVNARERDLSSTQIDLCNAYLGLASFLTERGNKNESAQLIVRASITIDDAASKRDGGQPLDRILMYQRIAGLLADSKKPTEGEALFRKSVGLREAMDKENPGPGLIDDYLRLASFLIEKTGKAKESFEVGKKAINLVERSTKMAQDRRSQYYLQFAVLLAGIDNREQEAESYFVKSLELKRKETVEMYSGCCIAFGKFLSKQPTRRSEAEGYLREAIKALDARPSSNEFSMLSALTALIDFLKAQGRNSDAVEFERKRDS